MTGASFKQKKQELVDKYGNDAEHIIASNLSLVKKGNMYKCPNHLAHKNGDKNPSMSWDSNRHFFNCFACGNNIDIYSYLKEYENYSTNEIFEKNDIQDIQTKIKKFSEKLNVFKQKQNFTEEQIKFLKDRGIEGITAKHFKLTNYNGAIAIPHIKNGKIIAVKLRMMNGDRKYGNIAGGKPTLFGYDNLNLTGQIIVVEGEFDAMILYQLNYENVVSIGSGANSLASLFEQTDYLFKQYNRIIVISDNDEAGDKMDAGFQEHFENKVSLVDKSYYKDCNDINDLFIKHGESAINQLVNSAKINFKGEWNLDDDPYTGLDINKGVYIPTGLPSLDYAINDIQPGQVTLITGRSNAGKSTFVNQIIKNAVANKVKTYLVVGEGHKDKIINKFYTTLVGGDIKYYDIKKINKREFKEPKPNVLRAIQKWHKEKLHLYVKSTGEYKTTEELFDMLKHRIEVDRYQFIVLDNLMSLLKVSKSSEKLEEQARFIENCHHLADSYNASIVVVLHPNKTYVKGQDMDFEQISGNSDISNKADCILNVIRTTEEQKAESIGQLTSGYVQVLKNRDYSELPKIPFNFDYKTFSFLEIKEEHGKVVIQPNVKVEWENYLSKTITYYNGTQQVFN